MVTAVVAPVALRWSNRFPSLKGMSLYDSKGEPRKGGLRQPKNPKVSLEGDEMFVPSGPLRLSKMGAAMR